MTPLDPRQSSRGVRWVNVTDRPRKWHVLTTTGPLPCDHDLVAVTRGDGTVTAMLIPRLVGPTSVHGCGICEQLHPLGDACPFASGAPPREVALGPFDTDQGTLYLRGMEAVRAA